MFARGFAASVSAAFARPGAPPALPAAWPGLAPAGEYVTPLIAQVLLARGASHGLDGNGAALVNGSLLIGAAGKLFEFSAAGAFDMWASIARARVLREIELADGMEEGKRAAWLAVKRAALEKTARGMLNAAAKTSEPGKVAALLAGVDFALSKWEHYA